MNKLSSCFDNLCLVFLHQLIIHPPGRRKLLIGCKQEKSRINENEGLEDFQWVSLMLLIGGRNVGKAKETAVECLFELCPLKVKNTRSHFQIISESSMIWMILWAILPSTTSLSLSHAAKAWQFVSDLQPKGNYEYAFETDNGIRAQQKGATNPETDKSLKVTGSFFYHSPEGLPIHLEYIADENGFQPHGAHLPTPPPIPLQIQRALAWIEEQKKKQALDDITQSFFENVQKLRS